MKKLACIIFVISLIMTAVWVGAADNGTLPFLRCLALASLSLIIAVVSGLKCGVIK